MARQKRITIHPREQLTQKARVAIHKYTEIQGKKNGYYSNFMVDAVLKAERMPRQKLYEWLDQKGYRWSTRHGLWVSKENRK